MEQADRKPAQVLPDKTLEGKSKKLLFIEIGGDFLSALAKFIIGTLLKTPKTF